MERMERSEYGSTFYQAEVDNAKYLSQWLNSHIVDFMNDGLSIDRLSTLSYALQCYQDTMEKKAQR